MRLAWETARRPDWRIVTFGFGFVFLEDRWVARFELLYWDAMVGVIWDKAEA